MSTKQQTNSTSNTGFQFDPSSMQTYLKNIGTAMPWLQGNVTNPYGSSAFQQESSIGQDQAAKLGQRGVSNVAQNAAGLGYATNGGMFNSMLQRAGQNTSMMQGQAFRNAIGNANSRQMQSAGMLSSFQPLMTGSNSNSQQTQTTSGLGTWLPQLAGAALGAAGTAFSGGATAGMGEASGLTSSAGGSMGGMGFNGVVGAFPGMNSGMGFPSGINFGSGGIPAFGGSSAYNYGSAGRG